MLMGGFKRVSLKIKNLIITFYRFLVKNIIPKNRLGDNFISYLNFYFFHKRFPAKKMTFNDELFRIKVSDEIKMAERVFTSDKEFVKLFIKAVVGDHYNVPTLAILRSKEQIEHFEFPENCVVKPTHASGLVKFIFDKEGINKAEFKKWMDLNHYNSSREANYRYLSPKLIVEPQIFGRTNVDDIKFFCVNGVVKLIQWDFDRRINHTRKLYDRNWNDLLVSVGYPISNKSKSKPLNLIQMIDIAEKIANYFKFVRIDMYCDENTSRVVIGEITHCNGSANEAFDSKDSEDKIAKILFG